MLLLGVLALHFPDGLPLCRGWGNPLFHFHSAQERGFHLTGMASSMKVVAIASGCILCSCRVRESRNIIYSANTFKDCSKSCQLQKTKVARRFYPEKYRSIYRNILELRYKSKKLQLGNLKPLENDWEWKNGHTRMYHRSICTACHHQPWTDVECICISKERVSICWYICSFFNCL